VLLCAAVCCSVVQCDAVCCCELQCVAVCCSVLWSGAGISRKSAHYSIYYLISVQC